MAAKPLQSPKNRPDFRSLGSTRPIEPTYSTDCGVEVEDVGYVRHSRAKLASKCTALEEAKLDDIPILSIGYNSGSFAGLLHS